MKKSIAIIMVALLVIVGFAACGNKETPAPATTPAPAEVPAETPPSKETDTPETPAPTETEDASLEKVKTAGKIIVGLDDTFAPMGFRDDDNQLIGFDIDLARKVGEILGVEVEFQPISWDAKEMELSSNKIDCIWNGMSVTPEREAEMSLTKPYLGNRIVVMTNEGVTIAAKEDLKDYNIGIQAGSAALEAVTNDEIFSTLTGKIFEYPTYDEVILDLKTGRLDCMIIDQVFGEYKNANLGGIYGTTEFDFGEDLYAVGFRKNDVALTNAVNDAIDQLTTEGVTGEISKTWFGKDIVL